MAFEIEKDFAEKNDLTEDQIKAISDHVNNEFVPTLKKEYDGLANQNAEQIINGAIGSIEKLTGVQRQQGQKAADYISTAGAEFVKSKEDALKAKEKELDEKLKSGKADETLKSEVQKLQGEIDSYKQKEAQFDEAMKGKVDKSEYEKLQDKYSSLKKMNAFNSVKPAIPETVNKYEADAKWKEFQNNVLKDHDIDFDEDGTPLAINKENKYKVSKLSDLVSKNDAIQELLKGREQTGTGKKKQDIDIKDVPFRVPKDATPAERSQKIREYLTREKGLSVTDSQYSKQFAELNKKILQGTAA